VRVLPLLLLQLGERSGVLTVLGYRKLTVTKAKSLASSADEQRKQVSVDPNATVSSALALVLQQFGFKQDSATDAEGEDYGLVFAGSGTQGEVWLEDMSKLGEYKELFAAPRLALRRKPWQLKVHSPPPLPRHRTGTDLGTVPTIRCRSPATAWRRCRSSPTSRSQT
jgi:hypothetical protein